MQFGRNISDFSVSFNSDGCVMEMMIASMDQMNQTNRPLQITAGLEEYVVRAQQDILLSEMIDTKEKLMISALNLWVILLEV